MVETPRYLCIELEGKDSVFKKGYGSGRNALTDGGVTTHQFKNKINGVLSTENINVKFMNKVFFEIDLRTDYYKPAPQELF